MQSDLVEKLFIRYYNDVLLYALSLCKNKAVAEDLVSEAFYKALISADETITNFKAWILAVCRNMYFNHHRREKSGTALDERMADEREHVLEKILRDESYRALYHAISLLPTEQREIVTLFYFEEMKLAQIAAIVGKTENNTKVILHRARLELNKILEVK